MIRVITLVGVAAARTRTGRCVPQVSVSALQAPALKPAGDRDRRHRAHRRSGRERRRGRRRADLPRARSRPDRRVPAARVVEAVRPHAYRRPRHPRPRRSRGHAREPRHHGRRTSRRASSRALAGRYALADARNLAVTFDSAGARPFRSSRADGELTRRAHELRSAQRPLRRARSSFRAAQRRGVRCASPAPLTETVEAAVPTRALARGEVRQSRRRRDRAPPEGRVRRRRLDHSPRRRPGSPRAARCAPGQALRQTDLVKPELVARNEIVTITYEVPGILLTMRGQALEAGAQGDLINVLNVQSKRTIQATVTGPGRVSVVAHDSAPGRRRSRPPGNESNARVRVIIGDRFMLESSRRRVGVTAEQALRWQRASAFGAVVAACAARRLLLARSPADVGEQPPLAAIENPTTQAGYKPVQMPMPAPQPAVYNPNSLWRNGSRAFFKDQRAHQIGDILTVTVNITDKADDRERDPAQPRQQGGFRRHRFHRQQAPAARGHRRSCPGASSPPTPPHRATARARSTARRHCRPTSPPW